MDHSASPSAPPRRARRIVLVGLAILGTAIPAFVVRSLGASDPWSLSADVGRSTSTQIALEEAERAVPEGMVDEADVFVPDGVVDAADGFIPDGVAVSVFDDIPAVDRLDPDLLAALRRAAKDAEADGVGLRVNSGWRSPEYQDRLWQLAIVEHGSPDEAARWVAPPETSAHVPGEAVDIGPVEAAAWLSGHGATHGLCQIYGNEPWHFELRPDAVDHGCPPMYADPTEDPRMRP